jgi:hypothetical protein
MRDRAKAASMAELARKYEAMSKVADD